MDYIYQLKEERKGVNSTVNEACSQVEASGAYETITLYLDGGKGYQYHVRMVMGSLVIRGGFEGFN